MRSFVAELRVVELMREGHEDILRSVEVRIGVW